MEGIEDNYKELCSRKYHHAGDVNHDVILDAIIPMYSTVPPNTEGEYRRYNVHMQTHVIALDLLVLASDKTVK